MLLRPARPGDEMAVARVHVRSWQVGYRGLLPDDYLNGLRPEDRAARYTFGSPDASVPHTTLAILDDRLAGFATTGCARETDRKDTGELFALYVEPDLWGRGVGRTLIADARRHLAEQGFTDAVLWVLVQNIRARRFYEIDEWVVDEGPRSETIWGITVQSIRYRCKL